MSTTRLDVAAATLVQHIWHDQRTAMVCRRAQHQRIQQKPYHSQSARPYLSCSIRLLSCFLFGLVVVYFSVLWSFAFPPVRPLSAYAHPYSLPVLGRNNDTQMNPTDGDDDGVVTIGVASTVTSCGGDHFIDGAAVLKHSLDLHSHRKIGRASKYNYQMYILYHPNATTCVLPLRDLGFTLLERDTPVHRTDIQGEVLRERIATNGCCGELELVKLEAFRLVQHPIIIHMDLDALVLKPLDNLIDLMLDPTTTSASSNGVSSIVPIMWHEKPIPQDVSLLFTKDYNVVAPRRHDKPFQGGFFMIKPSLDTYQEFVDIVRKGDYTVKGGWGDKVGPFHGGMTIQGLLPWYYEYLHPGQAVELNRCVVNNMNDKPKLEDTRNGKDFERCRTNEEECEDCRERAVDEVMTFHFTICLKPWNCLGYRAQRPSLRLCREMNRHWYQVRSQLEASWGRNGTGSGNFNFDHYQGFCEKEGWKGYLPIRTPYGIP